MYILTKDPFKTALGSSFTSITLLLGGLGLPEVKGPIKINFEPWPFLSIKSDKLQVLIGTPMPLWITAFVCIVLLAGCLGILLHLENKDKREEKKDKRKRETQN